jgi:hypothetical protein
MKLTDYHESRYEGLHHVIKCHPRYIIVKIYALCGRFLFYLEDATCRISETLLTMDQILRRHILGDNSLRNSCRENIVTHLAAFSFVLSVTRIWKHTKLQRCKKY